MAVIVRPKVAKCIDCLDDEGGHLNTGNVRPARLAAERFGFPLGSKLCKSCYEKWRYRLRLRLALAREAGAA